jgi:hypothetical protein
VQRLAWIRSWGGALRLAEPTNSQPLAAVPIKSVFAIRTDDLALFPTPKSLPIMVFLEKVPISCGIASLGYDVFAVSPPFLILDTDLELQRTWH